VLSCQGVPGIAHAASVLHVQEQVPSCFKRAGLCRQVLARGGKFIGATAHYDANLGEGPIIEIARAAEKPRPAGSSPPTPRVGGPSSCPASASDPHVAEYLAALKQYGDYADPPAFPHCQWSWMVGATLDQAFQKMTDPTRDSFMKALRSIKDFQAPLMLPDTSVNTTKDGQPAVSSVVVQKFNGKGYDTVTEFK
jgi:hypothetical protein